MDITRNRSGSFTPTHTQPSSSLRPVPTRRDSLPTPDVMQEKFQALTTKIQAQSPLIIGIQQYLRRKWLYERTLPTDIGEKMSFGESRRTQLSAYAGGEVVAHQYGINIAENEALDEHFAYKLHLGGEFNSLYHRQLPSDEYYAQCNNLYQAQGGHADDNVMFFNGEASAKRFLSCCPQDMVEGHVQQHLATHGKELFPGIYAVKFTHQPSPSAADESDESDGSESQPETFNSPALFYHLGARPSVCQVIRAIHKNDKAYSFSPRSCLTQLKGLASSDPHSAGASLRQIPPTHPCYELAITATNLVDGLVNHLLTHPQLLAAQTDSGSPLAVGRQTLPFNPDILADSLNTLAAVTQAMPGLTHDSISFADCYRTIAEELGVITTLCKPYSAQDFKQVTRELTIARLGPSWRDGVDLQPETFLFSSGMHALTIALENASQNDAEQALTFMTDRSGKAKTPIYFETGELVKLASGKFIAGSAVYATLNHSMPLPNMPNWSVDNLIPGLQQQIKQHADSTKPLTLILDATIEKRDDLAQIATAFTEDIAKNNLRILLCKSYQKYSNLGLTKVMSGSVTLLAAATEENDKIRTALSDQESALGWADNDDSQLLIHLLKHADSEFMLLDKAAENAKFVKDTLFNGKNGLREASGWQPGLPFIVLTSSTEESHSFSMDEDAVDKAYTLSHDRLLSNANVRIRGSFAFLESTQSSYEDEKQEVGEGENRSIMRLCFGMESKAELVERFYMASRLMASPQKSWSCRDAAQEIDHILQESGLFSNVNAPLTLQQKITIVANHQRKALSLQDKGSLLQQHLSTQIQQQTGEFVINKLLSVINQLSFLVIDEASYSAEIPPGKKDKIVLAELVDAFTKNDLPGVSPKSREELLRLNQYLALDDIKRGGAQGIREGIDRILTIADKMTSGMRLHFTTLGMLPDAVFQQQTPAIQQQLLEKLFIPLDTQTKMLLIDDLLKAGALHIAQACLDKLEALLQHEGQMSTESFLTHDSASWSAEPLTQSPAENLYIQERARSLIASLETLKNKGN